MRFCADTSTPSPAQDAGAGSKHLFPLPDGPRDWPAPRHAGLAALWAREDKGPPHVPGEITMTEKTESAATMAEEGLAATCEGIVRDYLAQQGI